jgi:hypothetical protein
MMGLAELDFWPLSLVRSKAPVLSRQPVWGILVSAVVVITSYVIKSIFVDNIGMDVFVYTLKIPICMVFGELIMLNLMQTAPVQAMKQPGKGVILIILNIVLAVAMYHLYRWFSTLIAGSLPCGAPEYVQELWIATALLGFTFPVIAIYTGFFGFWPLAEPRPRD